MSTDSATRARTRRSRRVSGRGAYSSVLRCWSRTGRGVRAATPSLHPGIDDDLADRAPLGEISERVAARGRGGTRSTHAGEPSPTRNSSSSSSWSRCASVRRVLGEGADLEALHDHALQEHEVERDARDLPRGETERDEPAAPPRRAQRLLRVAATDRVEHRVGASSGDLLHAFLEVFGVVVDRGLGARRPAHVELRG